MDRDQLKSKIIGLGEHSTRKSYYPELRKKIDELELYKNVFDQVDDGVMIINAAEQRLIYFNKALQNIFSKIKIHDRVHSFLNDPKLIDQIEKRELPDKTRLIINDLTDSVSTFEISFTNITDHSAEYYVGIFRNISEYVSLNSQLRNKNDEIQAQNEQYLAINEELHERNDEIYELYQRLLVAKEKAEESDRLKTAFLQNMSHEVRTPLNAVIGFSELLKFSNADQEEKNSYVDTIMKSGGQLQAIIDNIIHISTIDAGHEKVNMGSIRLDKFLQTIYQIHAPNFGNKGIDFNISNKVDINAFEFYSDETKLFQILSNLLNNAHKFTLQGKVTLFCCKTDNDLEFKIEDTGIGIAADKLDQIFNRFYRIREQHNLNVEGTGLGLSITKAYIEMLNGAIHVNSNLGQGTTFTIHIPIKQYVEY